MRYLGTVGHAYNSTHYNAVVGIMFDVMTPMKTKLQKNMDKSTKKYTAH